MSDTAFGALLCVLTGLVLRSAVSLYPHSGQGKPPMFGDYEAQRHWMEITLNLPVSSWYRQTEQNDLQYWGLDYPPLTAYHSKLLGLVASRINDSWVALGTSRGEESSQHRLFMRYTVLAADLLILLPACLLFACWGLSGRAELTSKKLNANYFVLFCLVSYPGLILIDHGHFQYNGVSLGLAIAATACFMRNWDLFGSLLFCCALGYKQMELYHSLPIFFYLAGKCFLLPPVRCIAKLSSLGVTVLSTFGLILLPFLRSFDDVAVLISRLFPFGRGLFEDKVSNVWCSLSVVIKLKRLLSQEQLVMLCSVTTLALHIPLAWALISRPSQRSLRLGLVVSSLIFFLFSYQVHEKSILIPAISVILLADELPLQALHFGFVSTFSMFPLLHKDQLLIPTAGSLLLFLAVGALLSPVKQVTEHQSKMLRLSFSGFVTLTCCFFYVPPPSHLPDIHAVAMSIYSCVHFLIFLLFFYYKLLCPKKPVTKLKVK